MKNQSQKSNCIESRYKNAQQILQGFLTNKTILNANVSPTWLGESDCFWYSRDIRDGKEFRLVDVKRASNTLAFDHQGLARALSDASGELVDATNLPFGDMDLNLESSSVCFHAFRKYWKFYLGDSVCNEITAPFGPQEAVSPDGKFMVFAKSHDLWLKNLETGEEQALTQDGDVDNAYAEPSTPWGVPVDNRIQALWSPDSQRIFTVQRDTREVSALPVIHHVPEDGSVRPKLTHHKFAYPGEEHVESLRLLTITIATGEQKSVDYTQIPVTRNSFSYFHSNLGWWNIDSKRAYFVDVDRYYKYAKVVELDTDTGSTKVLFEETSDTQINLMNNGDMWPSFVPLPDTNELLWYSERSGWAHLYLYNLNTGELKNSVTEGDWLVRDVVTFNPQRREVFIQTGCRTPKRNPYYRDLAKVNIDTGEMLTLASRDHDHFATAYTDIQGLILNGLSRKDIEKRGASPSGNYIVITRSRVNTLPESFVVDGSGEHIMDLDVSELVGAPEGWQLPEPVEMVAADGKTDIYGVVFRPSDFSPEKKYPVISETFSTPDFPWSLAGSFSNGLFEGQSVQSFTSRL